jgi:hypothetical protein
MDWRLTQTPYKKTRLNSGPGFYVRRNLPKIIAALVAVSPRPFAFLVPVYPGPAQLRLAARLLIDRQVDHTHPDLFVVRLAFRPDPPRRAEWLEVYERQVGQAVLALVRREAHAHLLDQLVLLLLAVVVAVAYGARVRGFYRDLAQERSGEGEVLVELC